MVNLKKLCVCGVATMSLGVPFEAAKAQCGTASWYHEDARTANGERYRPDGITAAHRSLPFGTRVEVRHQRTGRSVIVRINDRGPFIRGRIIDLSRGAKRVLGMDGLAPVCIAVVGHGPSLASNDDGERRAMPRRSRTRLAAADGEVKATRRASHRRLASIASRKRIASAERRYRITVLERRELRAQMRVREERNQRIAREEQSMGYKVRSDRFIGDTEM
jgi:rare lipoprotein A